MGMKQDAMGLNEWETIVPQYVQEWVEQIARQRPELLAVTYQGRELTYAQLNQQADALARQLLATDATSAWIGISTTRSLGMVVGVLAILKAGKAYLPLDPTYPTARLQQITSDAGLHTILCPEQEHALFTSFGLTAVSATEAPVGTLPTLQQRSTTAYVLYTSGSTGKPKGVCMGHGPLINLLRWQAQQSSAGIGSRTLQLAPLSFDVSFQEIFATLSTGGTLMLIDESLRIDLSALLSFIDEQAINRLFLPFVALQYLAEVAVSQQQFPASLREVMTAGEQLKITPQIAQFFTALPNCVLFNQYGPTECHVITQLALTGNPANWPLVPSIGQVIDQVNLYVLDEQLAILPEGETGELCFGGACVAEGYLNQPELTREKFITLTTPEGGTDRVYRTGDVGRLLPDGTIAFLGRRDDQVKIRGHRVELGEVEAIINQLEGVQQAVVVAREGADAQKQLIAYLVPATTALETSVVRHQLEQRLPDYMLPAAIIWLKELPKTTSGKVDKQQLPAPERTRPALSVAFRRPKTALEKRIAQVWSHVLQIDTVGLDDNFFELGGNSLLAQKTVAQLKGQQITLPITKLYQYPTVAGIIGFLEQRTHSQVNAGQSSPISAKRDNDVAIIGMAGRFPGASNLAALWELLREGRETIQFFTDDELDASIPERLKQDPAYVKARGILEQADQFDAHFFGLTPAVAQLMDPQQRIFLEIAWEVLEQTGYLPEHYQGRVGVFAGCGNNTYYLNNVLGQQALIDQVGAFQVMTLNEKDYIASRTAYQLNLKGPAVSVYAACSTSLLAVAQAVQSIREGQCDVALAGGASITAPIKSGHLYQEGAMLSRDGHCRSFDADAQGTVFSDGAGVVLVKSLAAAQRDGDTVYAVIKGVGVNNDGFGKGSFTAPSADGQAGAIAMAIADAAIDPATITYIEAHGTATPLGDPIEIEGLVQAFGEQSARQYCAIGSIKSNMGHLTQAAGVAGLIKTTLAMMHRQLPASLHYTAANPAIAFEKTPFYVNTRLSDWQVPPHQLRRAGISSFGVGGTNVHVVLEEANTISIDSDAGRPAQLITWSAKSVDSLTDYASQLATYLQTHPTANLADLAYTLQTTRGRFLHRRFVVASTPDQLVTALQDQAGVSKTLHQKPVVQPDDVVFLFPGQGSQYLNMGRSLYEQEAVFRTAVDTCATLLKELVNLDLLPILYPDKPGAEAEQRLRNTRYTQPALFVTEYALAQLWMSWGIAPTVFCGHSIGEFVGAHLAGVFSLPEVLKLIALRGQLVSELPRGSMLSIRKAAAAIEPVLPASLSLAASNSHSLCVVAGPDEEIADFARWLDEQEIPNQPLATSHAFHSLMMEPIVETFEAIVAQIPLNRPTKPIVSTVTGTWLTDTQATDPGYWARHLRTTVRFADALDTLLTLENPVLLEVGPGHVAATLARQQAVGKKVTVLSGVANLPTSTATCQAMLTTLGQLYMHGLEPDWRAFYAGQTRAKCALPTYAFQRKRCWVDPVKQNKPVPNQTIEATQPAFGLVASSPEISVLPQTPSIAVPMKQEKLLNTVKQVLENASGFELESVDPDTNFLEMGFDSLLLTQVALTLKKTFGVPITFRQLTTDLASPTQLVQYLHKVLPPDPQPSQPAPAHVPAPPPVSYAVPPVAVPAVGANPALDLIAQHLQLLAKQIELLQVGNSVNPAVPIPSVPPVAAPPAVVPPVPVQPTKGIALTDSSDLSAEEKVELKKPFGATARIERQASELTARQESFLQQLTQRYNQKTAKSKAYAQEHRSVMADPRVVTGFRPKTKEIVYPLVVNRSEGSRLWDIDGNEYIDTLNGFGSNLFGYQPEWVKKALHTQIDAGFEVGPQHDLAGEVCQLISELTGNERVALCNTGSEAVLGAMRVARTVTGRSLIVAFSGSYHGIVDEVLVRGTKKLKSFPAAPGIMPEAVQNMLILDYGTDESLNIIRERAHELAAVLVEPVQSRRPEFVPVSFLQQVRAITAQSGTALIFDEVITGFRTHPGGVQALFGIRADMATYGKVVGAGLPIGVIAGKRTFMDTLDGGFWQYGDGSIPEVGVTYFAGTFVRHPLALAAARASLTYMKTAGPALQQQLTQQTTHLANGLKEVVQHWNIPLQIVHFGSLWKIKFKEDTPYGELLFTLMREKGIHIWDNFPCFLTEAHTDQEIDLIIERFAQSVQELVEAGFFKKGKPAVATEPTSAHFGNSNPPAPGARLGRDQQGNPAWFIPNPDQPGKFLKVELN